MLDLLQLLGDVAVAAPFLLLLLLLPLGLVASGSHRQPPGS
jgi:hypothetical protein